MSAAAHGGSAPPPMPPPTGATLADLAGSAAPATAPTPPSTAIAAPTPEPVRDQLALVHAAGERSLKDLRTLGWWLSLAESGQKTPDAMGAAAALRHYYAQELGFPLLAAQELSVIDGKVNVSAKLLRAIAAQRGLRVVKSADADDVSCTAILLDARTGAELGRSRYGMDDARRAGLDQKRNWKAHPARMLWARASKYVLDDYAPAVTLGIWTDDEGEEQRLPLPSQMDYHGEVDDDEPADGGYVDDDSIPF